MKIFLLENGSFGFDYSEKYFLAETKEEINISSLIKFKNAIYTVRYKDLKNDRCCVSKIKIENEPDEKNGEQFVTCPFCGDKNQDSFELSDEESEYECGICGSTFSYERIVDVYYNSIPVKMNDRIIEVQS